MNEELHYYVDLRADFKRPESIDEPTGAELAAIIGDGLPKHGVTVCKNEGVDFAHYVECVAGSSRIELMVGAEVLSEEDNRWYIQPCAKRTFFGCQAVSNSDYRMLLLAVDAILRECQRVSDIRWFPTFETPEYLALMPYANGPIRDPDYAHHLHPLIWFDWQLNRITNLIVRPLGIISFFLLSCVLVVALPAVGPVVITVLFFSALALMTVVPFVLSILVDRAAKRKSESGG